jgi:hypothetical protein
MTRRHPLNERRVSEQAEQMAPSAPEGAPVGRGALGAVAAERGISCSWLANRLICRLGRLRRVQAAGLVDPS